MTDLTLDQAGAKKSKLFTTAALQKGVAFVVLVALLAFFSIFTDNFAAWNNMSSARLRALVRADNGA